MKKILTSFIVLLLLVSCCLIAAFPTSASDINYEDWDIIDGSILEYLGEDENVVVPAVDQDGNPITRIFSRAFITNINVREVVIPEGIEVLGDEVFQYCENLREISLPYSLKETGHSVFSHANLYALVIPGQLKKVRHDTANCPGLSQVIISSGVEEIEYCAFNGVFEELVLPKSVKKVAGMFRSALKHSAYQFNIFILNHKASLGENDPNSYNDFYEKYGPIGPLTYGYKGCQATITIYSFDNSPVEEYVNNYMVDKVSTEDGKILSTVFRTITESDINRLEALNSKNGISAPISTGSDVGNGDNTGDNNDDNTGDGTTDDIGGSTDNGGTGNTNTNTNINTNNDTNTNIKNDTGNNNSVGDNAVNGGTNSSILILVLAVIGGVVLLIIVNIVVVVLVLVNGKKKKKKAAKVEEVIEEVVEEAAVEEVTEEKGEEE